MPSAANIERAYAPSDLSSYTFLERVMIRAIGLASYCVVKLLGATVKFEVEGWENLEATSAGGKLPIYTTWHDGVFLSTYFWRDRGIVVMSSRSFDGEYTGRLIKRFGYGTVRGSSTRGHTGASIEMIRLMRVGCPAGFMIDGPKGPRHVAKMGAVLIAKKAGQPILPFVIVAAKSWVIRKSWDQTEIPKPFTRARVIIGPPISVEADAAAGVLNAKRDELQRALEALAQKGEQWRASIS
ncbi:MAG TPA: lysophospholipid acyltransferase family protein [Pyrinomonadaceae bacterium]